MHVSKLTVANYKSLRNVSWEPGPLSVIVGANAAGKSNFADFHEFLSDLYQHGLAVAVARKGGYENIAHRKKRRSRGAISVEIEAELTSLDLGSWGRFFASETPSMRLIHSFSFRALGRAIRSDFLIEHELIRIEEQTDNGWKMLIEVEREKDEIRRKWTRRRRKTRSIGSVYRQARNLRRLDDFVSADSFSSTELLVGLVSRLFVPLRIFSDKLGGIQVFQLSPTNTRDYGVPIPEPEMDRYGGNLPAVVDMLINRHPKTWANILGVMRQLLPGLERIEVDYTTTRRLGLYFHETGFGRPWNVIEVSDGTVHSLALLVAINDPRTSMLVLEEPENSIHTWILRTLMEAVSEASKTKQIVLTTHSRIVVDAAVPSDIWVMWRQQGKTNLAGLGTLDSNAMDLLENGDLTAFEMLDTGAIEEALPPPPID